MEHCKFVGSNNVNVINNTRYTVPSVYLHIFEGCNFQGFRYPGIFHS